MEEQMVELLEYLRHANVDVRKKAVEALFQYSTNDQCIKAMTIDVVKSLKSALYELIIFNVMKAMDKEDLKLKKHLMVQTDGTKIGMKGEVIRELTPNNNEELGEEDVVVALNIENLRLSLLIITNMCTLSPESQKHFLQLDTNNLDPKVTGSHFLVLLAWFLIDEFELLFENFAALLNTFTENDDFKTFLLSPEIRLEHRIRRYLLHSNHLIRCSVLRVMKHLFYSHDDENLSKRFCTFKEDEVHIIELNTRCLYLAVQKKYNIKPEHKEIIDKRLGSYWKPIPTLKAHNLRTDSLDEEIELSIDLFLTSTNIDFLKYYEGDLWELECVRNMMKLVHMLDDYLEQEYLKDKLSAVKMIYSGSI